MNKIAKLTQARNSLMLGLAATAILGSATGLTIGTYHLYQNHEIKITRDFTNQLVKSDSQLMDYLQSQQQHIGLTKLNFDVLYKDVSGNKNIVGAISTLNPDKSVDFYRANNEKESTQALEHLSHLKSVYASYKAWKDMDAVKIKTDYVANESIKFDSKKYNELYNIVKEENFQTELTNLVHLVNTNYDFAAPMDRNNQALTDATTNAKIVYDQIVNTVNQSLATKNYNLDQSETVFNNEHTQNVENMLKDLNKNKAASLAQIQQVEKEAAAELASSKDDLDSDEYAQLQGEIKTQIEQSKKELADGFNDYNNQVSDYNQFVPQDIKNDKAQVQEMINKNDQSSWGFFEYYLLYHWVSTSFSVNSSNSSQTVRSISIPTATPTPRTIPFPSLYNANSYQNGYKSKINLEKNPVAPHQNTGNVTTTKTPSKFSMSNFTMTKMKMPDMTKINTISRNLSAKVSSVAVASRAKISAAISTKRYNSSSAVASRSYKSSSTSSFSSGRRK